MKKSAIFILIFTVIILSVSLVSAFSITSFFKNLFGFGDNTSLIEGAPEDNAGFIRVYVYKEGTKNLVRNSEVTIYDDSLTEMDFRKSKSGRTTFLNTPLEFSEELLKAYSNIKEEPPIVYSYDSRTYYIDAYTSGYEPQVIDFVYTEGEEKSIEVNLVPSSNTITGNNVVLVPQEEVPKRAPTINYPGPGGSLLKLGKQDLFDKSKCTFVVDGVSISSIVHDGEEFFVRGFLRSTKHCSGNFRLSLSIDPSQETRIQGTNRISFELGPYKSTHGNMAGGLECPTLIIDEMINNKFVGSGMVVGVRLPVLACNDPEICPSSVKCIAEADFGPDDERGVECSDRYFDTEVNGYKTVRGFYSEPQSACDAYFKGDCASHLLGQTCDFELETIDEDVQCSYPKNGGAPAGGGQRLLELAVRDSAPEDVGNQCCFCGYDSIHSDRTALRSSCEEFFDNKVGSFADDPSFRCDVKKIIRLQNWESELEETSRNNFCKDPIAIAISSHGSPISTGKFSPEGKFSATCQNVKEIIKSCVKIFPESDLNVYSWSCQTFKSKNELDTHIKEIQLIQGEDQLITMVGNELNGWFTSKEELECTIQRTIISSPSCFSIKPESCKQEGAMCGPKGDTVFACLDDDGTQTTQLCCDRDVVFEESLDIRDRGIFTKPGTASCPLPKCSNHIGNSCIETLVPNEEGIHIPPTFDCVTVEGGVSKNTFQKCCNIRNDGVSQFVIGNIGQECPTECLEILNDGCLINGKKNENQYELDCSYDKLPAGTSCGDSNTHACTVDGKCELRPCKSDADCTISKCSDAIKEGDSKFVAKYSCAVSKGQRVESSGFCTNIDLAFCQVGKICQQTSPEKAECVSE